MLGGETLSTDWFIVSSPCQVGNHEITPRFLKLFPFQFHVTFVLKFQGPLCSISQFLSLNSIFIFIIIFYPTWLNKLFKSCFLYLTNGASFFFFIFMLSCLWTNWIIGYLCNANGLLVDYLNSQITWETQNEHSSSPLSWNLVCF